MSVSVCVCVCVRERKREREREVCEWGGGEGIILMWLHTLD